MKRLITMLIDLSHKDELRKKVFSSYFLKKAISILALITAMHCLYFWGAYELKLQQITKQIEIYQRNTLHDASVLFNDTFLSIERDTLYLKNSIQMKQLAQAQYFSKEAHHLSVSSYHQPEINVTLEDFFTNIMRSRVGVYSQIRFLNKDGMEIVRIDNNHHKTIVIPEQHLQDRAHERYFKHSQSLSKNQIYISPLSLKVRDGQIVTPYDPILRVCIPFFDSNQHFLGVTVISVLAKQVFDNLRNIAKWHKGDLWLVNQNGDWFLGPKPELEWGFMFPEKNIPTIQQRYPLLWQTLQTADSQTPSHLTEHGAMFSAIKFTPEIPDWQNRMDIKANPDTRWYLIAVAPQDRLQQIKNEITNDLILAFIILTFVFTIFSFMIALLSSHRRQALEELCLAKEEAEKASQAKSTFLSNMSHEIRTPLNAVLGLAYLLNKPTPPEDTQEIGHKIIQAGQSLQSILNDILDFSKIEAGKLELSNEPFFMKETLANVSTIMSSYAHNKNIELIISSDVAPNLNLLGDRLRIEQVLINLVGNAIKFTSQGYVALKVQILEEDNTAITIHFSVEDTGIGMNEEAISKIFNAFEQADSSTSKRFGGTGLGLSICTYLLQLMGSTLHVKSKAGKGSLFSFQITLHKVNTHEHSITCLKPLNVLIADDHEIALEALNNTAQALNWLTTCVNDGVDAVKLAQENPNKYDLYLLDWKMPTMDGLAAAKKIKAILPADSQAVIVLVTSYSHDELIQSPDAKFINQILEKPVTPSCLYDIALGIFGDKQPFIEPTEEEKLNDIRILVVDDNEYNRDIAERIFTLEGAKVTSVEDGQKALSWLEEHANEVDVVLMDIQMPIMDGYEATKRIRSNEKLRDLVVIALTAGAFETQRKAALDAGMNDFIAKPFDVPKAVGIIIDSLGKPRHTAKANILPTNIPKTEKLLNLERTLSLWGDSETVHRYLNKFLKDYGNIPELFDQLEHDEAAKLAHKLKGAAASLCLERLTQQAGELESALITQGNVSDVLSRLKICLGDTVKEIQKVLAETEASYSATNHSQTELSNQSKQLILRLYQALDSDDPNVIRPLLDELTIELPHSLVAPIIDAVDDYDFDNAIRQVEILAEQLGMKIGD